MLRKIILFLFLSVLLIPAANAAAESPDITPSPGQVNPYRTRSELLMDATAFTGVTTPEQAAEIWAKGLKMRSAAMQYTVMTDALKAEYARQLDALRSNWVTGMSSPWVDNYTITDIDKPDDNHTEIGLRFELMTSAGSSGSYDAKLRLVREGEFWRIERIWNDQELYWYTLYRP